MLIVVTFLTLISHFQYGYSFYSKCIPNSRFILNGHLCYCNSIGEWSEQLCDVIGRRTTCEPGQVIWQGCNQCICSENGKIKCTNACSDTTPSFDPGQGLKTVGQWCTPFRSYYVDCNICVCPASGLTAEAHCAIDASCSMQEPSPSTDFVVSASKKVCLPKVMYLFPCLRCLCSDDGYFLLDMCIEICHSSNQTQDSMKCIPRTFYKSNCSVCLCPDDSTRDSKLCSLTKCDSVQENVYSSLQTLRSPRNNCTPYFYTKPKCFYCNCNADGTINKDVCLESECIASDKAEYKLERESCSPREMVPVCVECFCLKNGSTLEPYCTKACSTQHKLKIVEKALKDSFTNADLVNRSVIKHITSDQNCEPNSVFISQGTFCFCPENDIGHSKMCTDINSEVPVNNYSERLLSNKFNINSNITCEPSTFVDIDCNTCFCSKKGTIDPKWCTYDNCKAKRLIMEYNHLQRALFLETTNDTCTPGSISKENCNFCICPGSGILQNRACTRNKCTNMSDLVPTDKLTCEPLEYYEVDCNVCFCPTDGIKNVAKCTKNLCENSYLRSDGCSPGELFSEECNVCVCPADGEKADRVCTNHTCPDTVSAWKKIFKLSHSLMSNKASFTSKTLDLCFPGEELNVGCKTCVCPDMGIRAYAVCTPTECDEEKKDTNQYLFDKKIEKREIDMRRFGEFSDSSYCFIYTIPESERNRTQKQCSAGSMYIIRCKQCICPFMGSISYFCRPLPSNFHCEQAFPNVNYVPESRRDDVSETRTLVITSRSSSVTALPHEVVINHNHTLHSCDTPGNIIDECYVCDCQEGNILIEEHCFKNDGPTCVNAKPTFLSENNKIT